MMRRAPGQTLLALARRILSRREIDRIVEPAIADLQHECRACNTAPVAARLVTRARAYLAALRVLGPRLLWASLHAIVAPPAWPVVRGVVVPSVIFVGILVIVSALGPAAARTREHWLFYLPDQVLWYLPYIAMGWMPWPDSQILGQRISPRASDLAKITALVFACTLGLSGWLGPLLREHYLVGLDLGEFRTASVHQWTLTEVWSRRNGFEDIPPAMITAELHLRAFAPALAVVCGTLGWAAVRARRLWTRAVGTTCSIAGLVVLIGFLRVGSVTTPRLSSERIAAEWAAVAAVAALAGLAIGVFARMEHWRRSALEARALALLHAIAAVKQSHPHDSRGST